MGGLELKNSEISIARKLAGFYKIKDPPLLPLVS
jgi:hypothetical protein